MEVISSYSIEIELTLEQRIEIAERLYSIFDLGNFGFGTESIADNETYHKLIDVNYPGVPRKATVKGTLQLRSF